jgi:hypothetical protein
MRVVIVLKADQRADDRQPVGHAGQPRQEFTDSTPATFVASACKIPGRESPPMANPPIYSQLRRGNPSQNRDRGPGMVSMLVSFCSKERIGQHHSIELAGGSQLARSTPCRLAFAWAKYGQPNPLR